MEWSIFQLNNEFIKIDHKVVEGIPCLIFRPKGEQGTLATIIYYHGWCSCKEALRFQAMSIASFGYQVIVPDALYHGERGRLDYEDMGVLQMHFWEIVSKNVEESNVLISYAKTYLHANREQIYLLGESMGAITVSGILSVNSDVAGIAGFNGCFSWKQAIESNKLPTSIEYEQFIMDHDLGQHSDQVGSREILMLNGRDDETLPFELQQAFFNAVKHLSDKIELIEFSAVGHRISSSMLENFITWLHKNTHEKE